MSGYFHGMPGLADAREARHRTVLLGGDAQYLPGGKLIDGTKSRDPGNSTPGVLRPGLLMGEITATGLYAPSIIGVLSAAYADNATEATVSAAVAAEIVRRIGTTGAFKVVGPPTAAGTVSTATGTYSAVNTETGAITLADMNDDFVAGSFIVPADGSETIKTFVSDLMHGYGIRVTDADGDSLAVVEFPQVPVGGIIKASQLLPVWPSDASLQAYIMAALKAVGLFVFDTSY